MSLKPPRPKPPPLTALRAFEAAARLGGFARAADELCVTPGAVSQQIRSLEEWAGGPLFQRNAHGVCLTPTGARVLPLVSAGFDRLGEAAQVMKTRMGRTITIAALPAYAQLWLSPRLPALRAALPEASFSVTALEMPPNLMREPFAMALFPGREGTVLARESLVPVCAPSLARDLREPSDLLGHVCLSDTVWTGDWPLWLDAAGVSGRVSGPEYSLYAMALSEALNGAGVLMGRRLLVESHLRSGALVAPFDLSVPVPDALRARLPPGEMPKVVAQAIDRLRSWS